MQVLSRKISLPIAALAAALLIVGCSSGKNNHGNNANAANTGNAAANTGAVDLRSPTVLPTVLRTPARPSSAQGGGAAGAPASSDKALTQALDGALLQPADFPSGYTASAAPQATTGLPGETAASQTVYAKVALPDVGVIADGLHGFPDTAIAQATFKDLQSAIQNADASLGVMLTPATSSAKIGDETQVFNVTLTQQGLTFSGYLVGWRRGRLGGTIIFAGSGADRPQTADDAVSLAQKQDAKLAAVKQ